MVGRHPPIEMESIGGFHAGPDEGVWACVQFLRVLPVFSVY